MAAPVKLDGWTQILTELVHKDDECRYEITVDRRVGPKQRPAADEDAVFVNEDRLVEAGTDENSRYWRECNTNIYLAVYETEEPRKPVLEGNLSIGQARMLFEFCSRACPPTGRVSGSIGGDSPTDQRVQQTVVVKKDS